MAETTTAKKEAELRAVSFYCPNKKRVVRIEEENVEWDFGEADCELCGSHGHLRVNFKCKCGKRHKVELQGW